MQERGQAAIEFIMLILIIIIYLLTITRPLVNEAKLITEDVQTIIRADSESKRIVNSITEVALLGKGTKKTIHLFVPQNAVIHCWNNKIGFETTIGARPYPSLNVDQVGNCNQESCCYAGSCDKNYTFPPGLNLDCQKELILGESDVIIYNDDATIVITG